MNIDTITCLDKQIYLLNLCIANEDMFVICFNCLIIVSLFIWLIIKRIIDSKKSKNLSVTVKNNFNLLGEGPLSCFYSTNHLQPKQATVKKKTNTSGKNMHDKLEKGSNSELKCTKCGRTVELTYQHTINKLVVS
jgi:uncharacterized protein YktB (UPF0637 family)